MNNKGTLKRMSFLTQYLILKLKLPQWKIFILVSKIKLKDNVVSINKEVYFIVRIQILKIKENRSIKQ